MFVAPFISFFLFFKLYLFSPFLVDGASMEPTLHNGQFFMLDKISYHFVAPQKGDIIVFSLPEDPEYYYVKRIVGLPGDRIHLEEREIHNRLSQNFIVPQDTYFVEGDNRSDSIDSRTFAHPFIPRQNIEGKYLLTFFSL